ncbi:unnamed protein product [Adineta ricciae]|uniref:Uncharacterized protein n=1 Tax=Adineta ricciae TaxID=249248 RepID=A0A814FI47_ADIRI|nr:unnamed protein product [Adineta ricciae]
MRSLVLVLFLIGSAHGLFGTITNVINAVGNTVQTAANQIGQTVSNLWNGATNQVGTVIGNVVDSAGNVYGQLVNTANGVQFAANFLWDNVFGPAYDLMIEGGQLFLDDKFGNIVSTIGRRSIVAENILSEKFAELTARFKSNIHQLFNDLFQMEKEALIALQKGEKQLEQSIRAFYARMTEVENQIKQWAAETKYELQTHALTVQGDWVHILSQYSQNIDLSAQTLIQMFQRLAQDLMKNLLEVALSAVPNALAIVDNLKQQGLLSFYNH